MNHCNNFTISLFRLQPTSSARRRTSAVRTAAASRSGGGARAKTTATTEATKRTASTRTALSRSSDAQTTPARRACSSFACFTRKPRDIHVHVQVVACVCRVAVCDGRPECDDGSDEWLCLNRSNWCQHPDDCVHCNVSSLTSSAWSYARPLLVPTKWLCDGDIDCPNGTDEHNCHHKGLPPQ